jgi:hypothetical protein
MGFCRLVGFFDLKINIIIDHIVSGLLKRHFDNREHFFEGLYDEGAFLKDIFTERHFLKDRNSGTFRQGHL